MAKISDIQAALNMVFNQSPGMQWTVRSLYYRMVTMKIIPNKLSAYKNFDAQVVKLREEGEIGDHLFVDTARRTSGGDTYEYGIDEFFRDTMNEVKNKWEEFSKSMWDDQDYNIVVVLEKDALTRMVEPVTKKYRVPLAVGRGYSSRTQILQIEQELVSTRENIILYLGDHDPTGIDIERSLEDRLYSEASDEFSVTRVALTYEQARQYQLPPDPAKVQDARSPDYVRKYGNNAWELDAIVGISPQRFQKMIEDAIKGYIDSDKWNRKVAQEKRGEEVLKKRFGQAYDILKREFPEEDDEDDDDDVEDEDDDDEEEDGEGDSEE